MSNYNVRKIASIFCAVLLVSVLGTTGTFFAVPVRADSGQSNSTNQLNIQSGPLPVAADNAAPDNTGKSHVWFMPHMKVGSNGIVSPLTSNAKLAAPQLKLGSLSALARIASIGNDGFCAYAPALTCANLLPAKDILGSGVTADPVVMHNAKILLVFWAGPGWTNCATSNFFESPTNDPTAANPNDCTYINEQVQFFKDMCSDPFMKIISVSYTDSNGGAGGCSVVSNAGNPWVDTRAFPSHTAVSSTNPLLDSDIRQEARNMLAHVGLSANINTEVFVFTPYGKDSCFDANGPANNGCFSSQMGFCAYHDFDGTSLVYANMPDGYSVKTFNPGVICSLPHTPNSDPVADTEVSPLSHEAMESFTDPDVTTGYRDPNTGGEIGDECAYDGLVAVNSDDSDVHFGLHGDPYFIQSEWSNSNGGCALVENSLNPPPPALGPGNLAASNPTTNSIELSWDTSATATSYNLFRSTSTTGPFTTLAGSPAASPFTDTGLSPGTAYFYEITASTSGGTSAISGLPAASAITLGAPTAPLGVAAVSTPPTSITVSWTNNPVATGYNVYRSTSATGPFTTILSSPATSPYVDSGLTPNTKYFYKVSATNTSGESALSAAVSATTAPAAPTNVIPTALSTSSIKVAWSASLTATSYKVYRDTTAAFATPTLVGSPTTTTFTDTGLSPGFQYYYEVSAVNANGESDKSTPPATTFTINIPPTGVAVIEASQTALSVSWTAAEGSVTGYKVYRATAAAGPFTTLAGSPPGTGFGDNGLLSGKQYFYEVSTLDSGGESAKSTPPASGFTVPAIPIGIVATPTSSGSIALTWTASTGATSYSVTRDTTAAFTSSTIVGTPTTNSFTDTGLNPNTTYYYEISAIDSGGTSPPSGEASTTTLPPSPLAPTNVVASANSATSVTVTWNVSEGTSVSTVYRATSPSGPFTNPVHKITMPPLVPKGQTGTTLTTFTDTGLTPNTTYYYKVRASNSGGTSPLSAAASVSTLPLPPAPPGGVKATALSTSSISVSWTASPTATVYSIFRSSSPSGPFDTQVGTSTISPFIDNTLVSGTKYYYQISASNAGGVSLDSATVFATTITDAPGGVVVTSPTTSISASLTWEAPTGAVSYKIYRSTAAAGPFTTSIGTSIIPSFTNTGLTPNTTYYYEVSALDAGGESAKSVTVSALTAPIPPSNIMASRNPDSPSTALEISWNGAAGATGYNIYRSTSATGTFTQVNASPDTGLLFGDSGLLSGTKYFYKVSSINAGGEGPKSAPISGITAPAAPTGVVAILSTPTSIKVTWNPSFGATSYKIFRDTQVSFATATQVGTSTTPSFTNTGLTPLTTTYYYEVMATNANGDSALSGTPATLAAPHAPSGVKVTVVSANAIKVTWTASTNAVIYEIYRDTTPTFAASTQVGTSTVPSFTNTGLPLGSVYYYEVKATNANGDSALSGTPTFSVPTAPTNITTKILSTTSIQVTWTGSAEATSYSIYRFAGNGPWHLAGTSTTTTFTDTGLSYGMHYIYEVKATNTIGESANSAPITTAFVTLK